MRTDRGRSHTVLALAPETVKERISGEPERSNHKDEEKNAVGEPDTPKEPV
jgi:hypothetical protein